MGGKMRRITLLLIISSLIVFQIHHIYDEPLDVELAAFDFLEDNVSVEWVERPVGDKGIWIIDLFSYSNNIVLDGNLSDWDGIPHDFFNGVDIYLAYNESFVSVAATWKDTSQDAKMSEWSKTGATDDNATHGTWVEYHGNDDMVAVGFSNGTYTDMWTWAYSIRGDASNAYEDDGAGTPDAGVLPFVRNLDVGPATQGWLQPATDNSSVAIGDHGALANGTAYKGWFDDVPSGSQTDVDIAYTWNTSGDDMYVVEFRRLLDTGSEVDDIKLDFNDLTGMSFFVGSANKQDFIDMDVGVLELDLADDNEPAEFEIDPFVNPVTDNFLFTGHLYDDYLGFDILVHLSGWNDTYSPGYLVNADVNLFTGGWNYLFDYNEVDMPIGDHTITAEFKPKYDESFKIIQDITIDDIDPPQILGIVDLSERYPDGVPSETEYVTVTVGASDNYQYWSSELGGYTDKDSLTLHLYSWKDDGVALMTPMKQFAPGGATFQANITLDYSSPADDNNYTYYVQVWDPSNNKVTSDHYWFVLGDIPPDTTPTTITLTEPTTSIGIAFISGLVIGTISLLLMTYIILRKVKLKR